VADHKIERPTWKSFSTRESAGRDQSSALIVSDNLSSRALRRRPTDELRVARISSRLCVEQQTIHSNGATSFLSVVIRKPTVIFHPLGLQTIDTLPGGLRTPPSPHKLICGEFCRIRDNW
jgi:hypothetical protein